MSPGGATEDVPALSPTSQSPLIGQGERPSCVCTCTGWKPDLESLAFRARKGRGGREKAARLPLLPPPPPRHPPPLSLPRPRRGLHGRLGGDGSSSGGDGGGRRRRLLLLLLLGLGPAVIRAGGRGPPMRLLAGWLCLSLASVWLARRMWTLRSPLSRSLYVNMTSGPGGPAAAAGGGKDTHQVLGRSLAERGRGAARRSAFPRSAGPLCGAARAGLGPGLSQTFPGPGCWPRGAFCSAARAGDSLCCLAPRAPAWAPRSPALFPGRRRRPRPPSGPEQLWVGPLSWHWGLSRKLPQLSPSQPSSKVL